MTCFPFEPLVRVALSENAPFGLHTQGTFTTNAGEDLITYQPMNENAQMLVTGLEIGRDFHWRHKAEMRFGGVIQIQRRGESTTLLNIIKAEKYLESVIGSEMNPLAPEEFLKAHAIIARSWLLKRLGNPANDAAATEQREPERIIRWTGTEAHSGYDVCNTDHCQRYQGLGTVTPNSTAAVQATRGLVLIDMDGEIADTRYSKCCGGETDLFSTCWEDTNPHYLKHLHDPYCEPERLKKALATHPHLLKDFDLATDDYYRWQVKVAPELIRENLQNNLGVDVGEILDLKPVKTGTSGRIFELLIVGSKSSVTVGKELTIRKLLSESHLYSSAFTVTKTGDGFRLDGKGWGHGVGLCQIGAAVMAAEGHTCEEILSFYYPDTSITAAY